MKIFLNANVNDPVQTSFLTFSFQIIMKNSGEVLYSQLPFFTVFFDTIINKKKTIVFI